MMISMWWAPNFNMVDNLREQGSEGSEHQNTTEVAGKSGTDQQCLANPSAALEIGEIEDEVNHPKKGRKKSKTQFFAKGALATPVPQPQDLGYRGRKQSSRSNRCNKGEMGDGSRKGIRGELHPHECLHRDHSGGACGDWRPEQGASNEVRVEHQGR